MTTTTVTFPEYVAAKRQERAGRKAPADILERWNNRVLPQGMHLSGEAGAEAYLAIYGKGIGYPKVILLALQAEAAGYPDMAHGFWKRAYEIETGQAPVGMLPAPAAQAAAPAAPKQAKAKPAPVEPDEPQASPPGVQIALDLMGGSRVSALEFYPEPKPVPPSPASLATPPGGNGNGNGHACDPAALAAVQAAIGAGRAYVGEYDPSYAAALLPLPEPLWPGRISTMQPIDAPEEQLYYVKHPDYWGQPKRDGIRTVVTAAPVAAFYQSRSTKLRASPDAKLDAALRDVAGQVGLFILDAELYYPDANGGEHRTGAQAAKVNIKLGQGHVIPHPRLGIFKALYACGESLTGEPESRRIEAGEKIGALLARLAPDLIEVVPTYRTPEEKALLVATQEAEGREGEVWVRCDVPYRGGKDSRGVFVRTKRLHPSDVVILSLSRSTAAKNKTRNFGAVQVGMYDDAGNLVPVGSVGTGFTVAEAAEIERRHNETPGRVVMAVVHQGWTEDNKLWHARYQELRDPDDKMPEECLLP